MTPGQPRSLSYYVERVFVVVGLLLMLGALKGLFVDLSNIRGMSGPRTTGNFGFQLFSVSIYLVASAVILTRVNLFLWLCSRNKALILMIALVMFSAVWSVDPSVSLRRAVALLGTTIFAIYIVMRFRPEEMLDLLCTAFALAVIATLIVVFLFPDVGVHPEQSKNGAWRGIFGHKNNMGRTMTLGGIVYLVSAMIRPRARLVLWLGFIVCACLVALSGSRTAWITLAALLVMIWPLQALRRSQTPLAFRSVLIGVLILSGGLLLLLFYEAGLDLVGRDATFSARTKIWGLAFELGWRRPILGYGYRAFWTEANAGRLYMLLAWGEGFDQGHSGFLDLWLELGIAGVSVFVLTLVLCLHRVMSRLTSSRDPIGLWFPLFLAFMILTGLTEAAIFQQGRIEWILYVTTLLYLCMPQPERQSTRATSDPPPRLVPPASGLTPTFGAPFWRRR